jgi:hypothetical protein
MLLYLDIQAIAASNIDAHALQTTVSGIAAPITARLDSHITQDHIATVTTASTTAMDTPTLPTLHSPEYERRQSSIYYEVFTVGWPSPITSYAMELDQREPKKTGAKGCVNPTNVTAGCTGDAVRLLPNALSSILYLIGGSLLLGYTSFGFVCGPALHYYIKYSTKAKNKVGLASEVNGASQEATDEIRDQVKNVIDPINNDWGHAKKAAKWAKSNFETKKRDETLAFLDTSTRDIVATVAPTLIPTATVLMTTTTTITMTRTMTLSNYSDLSVTPSVFATVSVLSATPTSGAEHLYALPLLAWLLGSYKYGRHRSPVRRMSTFQDIGQDYSCSPDVPRITVSDEELPLGTSMSTTCPWDVPGGYAGDTEPKYKESSGGACERRPVL